MRMRALNVSHYCTLAKGRFLLVVTLLAFQSVLTAMAAESRQEDGGEEKPDPQNLDQVTVHGTRGSSGGGGRINLYRFFYNPNGGGRGGLSAPAPPDDSTRTESPCDETDFPVVLASGNKVLDETDFSTSDGIFEFTRTYSKMGEGAGFGTHWRHPFAYNLTGLVRSGWGQCPSGHPRGEPCSLGNKYTTYISIALMA